MNLRPLFVFLILSGFVRAQAPPGSDTLRILPDTFQNRMPLAPWLGFVPDTTRRLTLNEARRQALSPPPDEHFVFPSRSVSWFRFWLQNPDTRDTLHFRIGHVRYGVARFDAWILRPAGAGFHAKAGIQVDYRDLSVPEDRRFLRLIIPPGTVGEVWLRVEQPLSSIFTVGQLEIMPEAAARQMLREYLADNRLEYQAMVFFLCIFGLIACIFGVFWLNNRRDKSYFWYAGYGAFNFLYYFRLFENRPSVNLFFTYRMAWYQGLEATTAYLISIAYIQFLRAFLELRQRDPWLDRRLREIAWAFAVWMFVDLLVIKPVWGQEASFSAYLLVRGIFFAISFLAFARLFRLIRYPPAFWVNLGMTLLVVNSLATWLEHRYNWLQEAAGMGLLRRFTTETGYFYFLNMKSAIVLEMLCFVCAFAVKSRLDREAMLKKNDGIEPEKTGPERNLNAEAAAPEIMDPFLSRLRRLAEERLHDPLFDATALARLEGMSLKTLNARLLKSTGLRAAEFLRLVRLKKAAALLRSHPTLNVSEIADRTGYSGSDVFSRAFRRHFGKSPLEWRREHGAREGLNQGERPA